MNRLLLVSIVALAVVGGCIFDSDPTDSDSKSSEPDTKQQDQQQQQQAEDVDSTGTIETDDLTRLAGGESVTVMTGDSSSYTVTFTDNQSGADVVEVADEKGTVTYFEKDGTGEGVAGTWKAVRQKTKDDNVVEIASDDKNAMTVTIGDDGSFEMETTGTVSAKDTVSLKTVGSTADSLFDVLVERIQDLDTVGGVDEVVAFDFISLRDGFQDVVKKDPAGTKGNLGLMVSSLLALNKSKEMKRLADSLEAYFDAVDNDNTGEVYVEGPQEYEPVEEGVMHKALRKEGVIGLGKALAAKTPSMAMAASGDPTWPKFVKLSYLQGIIEDEILPVMNAMIDAAGRLENAGKASVVIEPEEGDTFEIDLGEVYAVDAYLHLARAYLTMYCIYDMDIYEPGTKSYAWIDSLYHSESIDRTIYRLKGDTLYEIQHWDDSEPAIHMAKVVKYNMERDKFMTIRSGKNWHSKVKADLVKVPQLVKSGLAYIRAETDGQKNDLIKLSHITDADAEMADLQTEMIEEGLSEELASKFRSAEAVADFVAELLSGPYTFNETVDNGKTSIKITVDITALLDNPVQDMRDLLPKHKWINQKDWLEAETDVWDTYSDETSMFSVWDDEAVIDIDESKIDSIVVSDYGRRVYLKEPVMYHVYMDSSFFMMPIRLVDNAGKIIPLEDIEDMVEAETFFPYFDDYTMGGLLPGMTRAKWLDLIYQ